MTENGTRLNNKRRERFCRGFVVDLNATQSYIDAGYSPKGASASASRLLTDAKVMARIGELQNKVEAKIEDDAVMLRKNLRAMASVTVDDIFDEGKNLRPMSELSLGARLLIQGFRFKDGELTEVKVESKLKAMELLGKHHAVSAWEETVHLSGGDDRVARIRRAQERAGKRAGVRREPIDVTPIQNEIQS